jgi:hypothetical protein
MFSALVDDVGDIVGAIEQLERMRRDARSASLLHSARVFAAAVQTYFDSTPKLAAAELHCDSLPESLMCLAEEAVDVAHEICSTTGGPGSSALLQHASALRGATEVYWQGQRRLAAEVLRQVELPLPPPPPKALPDPSEIIK